MNIQQYATILSRFNRVPAVEPTSQNVVLIHWNEQKWDNSLVGQLRNFDAILYHGNGVDRKPLVKALGVFYRTDCVTTTFLSRHKNRRLQQMILMGNERILTPTARARKTTAKSSSAAAAGRTCEGSNPGVVHVCVFPFFVRDPKATLRLRGGADGMYPYRDGVLFADHYQVPYPGGSYYDRGNSKNDYGRLCFLTRNLEVVSDVYADWYGKRGVLFFPFQTKVATLKLVSDFLTPPPTPVGNVCFPSTHLKSSGSIHKRLSQHDPDLLLQDVLNTYASANASVNQSSPLDNVALFVEYPFVSGFENNCGGRGGCVVVGDDASCPLASSSPSTTGGGVRYAPFLVNGLNPKTVLQVKHPYDRYVEYQKIDTARVFKSDWTVFLYERYHEELSPSDVEPVRIENTILGYRYRNAFLCLSYPMLADAPRNDEYYESLHVEREEGGEEDEEDEEDEKKVRRGGGDACGLRVRNATNLNTDCLLHPVEDFDPKKDPRLKVFGTYGYDDLYDVYQVKHVELRNELWCLVDKNRLENLETCRRRRCGDGVATVTASKRISAAGAEDPRNAAAGTGEPKYFKKATAPLTKFVYEWIEFFYKNADRKDYSFGNVDVFRLALLLARHKVCLSLNLTDAGNASSSSRSPMSGGRRVRLRGREYVFDLDRPAIDFINDMRLATAKESERRFYNENGKGEEEEEEEEEEEKEELGEKRRERCVIC